MLRKSDVYVDVIRKFVEGRLDAKEFCKEYDAIRTKDVDAELANESADVRESAFQLMDKIKSGEISKEEFSNRHRQLYGWTDDYVDMIDAIEALYSTASQYTEDPVLLAKRPGVYVDARGLLTHAKDTLKKLTSA